MSITDDDVPDVTVSFGRAAYSVAESDDPDTTGATENQVAISVSLLPAPERAVEITVTHTPQGTTTGADYSISPTTLSFAADEQTKTVTFTATPDTLDDDDESVSLGFSGLPEGVSAGTTAAATVSITDDDEPEPDEGARIEASSAVGASFGAGDVDLPADVSTTATVAVGTAARGAVTTEVLLSAGGWDSDWFKAELVSGQAYEIEALGATDGAAHCSMDSPFLEGVYDADGVSIERASWHRRESQSSLTFTPDASGAHYISVAGGANLGWGTYLLALVESGAGSAQAISALGVQGCAPDAPTNLSAQADDHDSVTLSWTAPSHSAITGYRIIGGAGDSDDALAVIAPDTGAAATSYVHTGLEAETAYRYRVAAISAQGVGAVSQPARGRHRRGPQGRRAQGEGRRGPPGRQEHDRRHPRRDPRRQPSGADRQPRPARVQCPSPGEKHSASFTAPVGSTCGDVGFTTGPTREGIGFVLHSVDDPLPGRAIRGTTLPGGVDLVRRQRQPRPRAVPGGHGGERQRLDFSFAKTYTFDHLGAVLEPETRYWLHFDMPIDTGETSPHVAAREHRRRGRRRPPGLEPQRLTRQVRADRRLRPRRRTPGSAQQPRLRQHRCIKPGRH